MHPSVLVEALREQHPEYAGLNMGHQHKYAGLVVVSAFSGGIHHRSAGVDPIPNHAIPISMDTLREKFGKGGFERINEIVGCIDRSEHWNFKGGETYAYWLNDHGRDLIRIAAEMSENQEVALLDDNGHRVRILPNGVRTGRDSKGRNAITDARIPNPVPIRIDAIDYALANGIENIDPDVDKHRAIRVTDQLRLLRSSVVNENDGMGMLPQAYEEAASGRLYGVNGLSLQNATKQARYLALHNSYDYDFENCHYQILAQLGRRAGIDTPTIDLYVARTRPFREDLAAQVGVSVNQIKRCLIAVIYGARMCTNQACAIARHIGEECAERLFAIPEFHNLQAEARQVGRWAVKQAAVHGRTGGIINCRGKSATGTLWQKMSHILQGYESAMLHAALELHGDQVLVLQHDGFTVPDELDTARIEQAILEATGFEMPVTTSRLVLHGLQ